ncbi:MAG: glucosaminidase domain-containing protein [Halarcobacter sp.]
MNNTKIGLKEKLILVLLLFFTLYLSYTQINKSTIKQTKELKPKKVEKKKEILVSDKKRRFDKLFIPKVTKVYDNLYENFLEAKKLIELEPTNEKLDKLKKEYNVKTNENLLIALKPHPISITLSQAAIESAWGTSRFLKEANNVFGVWSFNKNEPRIAAYEKREDTTIYLKKFATIEDAIKQYYKMLSSKKIYFEFKKTNFYTNDPIEIAKKLTNYSEQGEEYVKKIIAVLKYNNFAKYDKID